MDTEEEWKAKTAAAFQEEFGRSATVEDWRIVQFGLRLAREAIAEVLNP